MKIIINNKANHLGKQPPLQIPAAGPDPSTNAKTPAGPLPAPNIILYIAGWFAESKGRRITVHLQAPYERQYAHGHHYPLRYSYKHRSSCLTIIGA